VSVEKVGEAGRRDGGDRGGGVVERGDKDDGLELEMVPLAIWDSSMRRLQVASKAINRGPSSRRIGNIESQRANVWAREVLDHGFVVVAVTDDEDDESLPLHIER